MEKYFVCHRYRATIHDDYVREFYNKKEYSKLYDTLPQAQRELREGFFDDSDYDVYKVTNESIFERISTF